MRDTNGISSVTEGRVLAALISTGATVALPFGVARYDLVLDTEDGFKRVQCKTGRLRDGVIKFNAYSVHRVDGHYSRTGYAGTADLFGVYCPDTDKVYLLPVGDNKDQVYLRVEKPRNNQKTSVRWAADYEVAQ